MVKAGLWLDCGEVEDEKTRNGYLQKRRAGSVRARDVRVLDTTGGPLWATMGVVTSILEVSQKVSRMGPAVKI